MRKLPLLIALALLGCGGDGDGEPGVDAGLPPAACEFHEVPACAPGEGRQLDDLGGTHIAEPEAITWPDSPPASGSHRPQWARWGEYSYLPPERWLHNLEHGGAALLYHPCASAETVEALRALARARPSDDGGFFRWILTPYENLPSEVAVVTWRWRYEAPCVQVDEINDFLDRHYRQAPEDIASEGAFDDGFIGR